jgi:hypothetical protein
MPATRVAFRIFSDFANELAMESRVPELGGGTAVGRPECGAEVTVAGEAKVQAQRREVVVLSEKIERPRQPQPQLVAIQGQTFYLLEDLCEIHGRAPHFIGDVGQSPAPRQVTGQHELRPIHEPLAAGTCAGRVRRAGPERPLRQGQRQALCLKGLSGVLTQAVPQDRHERLSPRVNPQALWEEREPPTIAQERARRQFAELRFGNDHRETGIAARHWMGHAVTFVGVEEQYLVRLGHRLVVPHVAYVGAPIRKHELRRRRVLFRTRAPDAALAVDVTDGNDWRDQERLNCEFAHA